MSTEKVVIGDATLYCGDCLEILPTLPKVDAVVTDPPYGICFKSNGQHFKSATQIKNDHSQDIGLRALEWASTKNICTVAFASPSCPWPGNWRNLLVWDKGEHVGIGGDRETCWKRSWELVQVTRNGKLSGKRDGGVLRFNAVSPPPSGHPAEKPISLMSYLIAKTSDSAAIILDPFMGSGTTGVASIKLGRKFIGIEIDPRYFDIACERIAAAQAQAKFDFGDASNYARSSQGADSEYRTIPIPGIIRSDAPDND